MRVFFLVSLLLGSVIFAFGQNASLFDELSPLYPDSQIQSGRDSLEFHVPKGGQISVNVLINELVEKDILQIDSKLMSAFANVKISRLLDVPVEENTGLDSRTEQYIGKINPNVIRRAPFQVYEVLQPITSAFLCEHSTEAINVKWFISEDMGAGTYRDTIEIRGATFEKQMFVNIVVHDIVLPKAGKDSYGYTNWFSLKNMAIFHGEELWTDRHWKIIKEYAETMAEGRQNVFWVTLQDMFDKEGEEFVLQNNRLEKLIRIFTDAGLHYIEFAPLAHRTNNDWSSTTLSSNIQPDVKVNSPEGYQFYEQVFQQLKNIIEENDWNGRALFHISDEPTDEVVEDYKVFVEHLRKYFPETAILEATMTLGLSEAVDYWCPQVQEYQKHQDFFEKRKEAGDQVWVYTCLIPGGKWLNRLLDQHKLRQVFLGWSLAKFELGGFLHWGLNHYNTPNPLLRSVVDHPHAPNTKNKLPAGDTHVIYPGIDGPWSSLRFNAHRLGMEDAELFKLLDQKQRDELMSPCFSSFDEYTTDVDIYRDIRRKLLDKMDQR